jgi:predicted transcriptional regulator
MDQSSAINRSIPARSQDWFWNYYRDHSKCSGCCGDNSDCEESRQNGGHVRNAEIVRGRRPELGHLESAVLSVVAASAEPQTVAEVQVQLNGDPAYTTVMSTLARLAEKGALRRTLHGRAYRYELAAPSASIDDALTARSMRRLMGDGADRAAVLARFVAELDDEEERMLTDLLDRQRNEQDRR